MSYISSIENIVKKSRKKDISSDIFNMEDLSLRIEEMNRHISAISSSYNKDILSNSNFKNEIKPDLSFKKEGNRIVCTVKSSLLMRRNDRYLKTLFYEIIFDLNGNFLCSSHFRPVIRISRDYSGTDGSYSREYYDYPDYQDFNNELKEKINIEVRNNINASLNNWQYIHNMCLEKEVVEGFKPFDLLMYKDLNIIVFASFYFEKKEINWSLECRARKSLDGEKKNAFERAVAYGSNYIKPSYLNFNPNHMSSSFLSYEKEIDKMAYNKGIINSVDSRKRYYEKVINPPITYSNPLLRGLVKVLYK